MPPTPGNRGARSPWFLALVALVAARYAFLAAHLHYPDLLLDYPFAGVDGLDWISTGLHVAGYPVRSTGRAPLLPLLIALLERLGALSWFPVLHQLVLPVGVLALFRASARWHGERAAFLASLLPLLSASATAVTLDVMADTLAAVLLFLALLAFLAARGDGRWYLAAGALGALSGLSQQAALLLPICCAPVLLLHRRQDLRRPPLWVGALLFAVTTGVQGVWTALQALRHGASSISSRQWMLLAPHLDKLPFWAGAALAFFGAPALVLAVAGGWRLLRRRSEHGLLFTTELVVVGAFFVLLYTFVDHRFLMYLLLPVTVLVAAALEGIRNARTQVVVGLLAALWAAIPVPGAAVGFEARFALVPFAHYLDTTTLPASLVRITPREAWLSSPWARVLIATSRRPPGRSLTRDLLGGADVVIFLHRPADLDRYSTQHVLGGALRTRVKWVPEDQLPADWPGWRARRFAGTAGGYALFRVRSPCDESRALVAMDLDDPAWKAYATEPSRRAPRPELAAACATAARVQGLMGPEDARIALLLAEPPRAWQQVLPFVLVTSNLYVFQHDERAYACRELARRPARQLAGDGALRILDGRISGYGALVPLDDTDPAERCPGLR